MSATALEVTLLLAIGAGLVLYVLLGGADFGGGVWDLVAHGRTRERERSLISAAIGPVWEANHVWLIFVVTALFAGFPGAFAALGVALYLPFGIAIAGIVMRGGAFAFRAYGEPNTGWQRGWTRVFGIASLVTPVVLGMSAAAIASGRIHVDGDVVRADLVGAWTGPLSWVAGLLSLVMCAFLAATYLTVEAVQREISSGPFVWRYSTDEGIDGLSGSEGAFLICAFWLAAALALIGRTEEAKQNLRQLAALRNDVGLLSEEYDPATGRLLGNFPQAFSHIGLLHALFTIVEEEERRAVA